MAKKRYSTSCWDPIEKKVRHYELRADEYENDEDAERLLKEWRECKKSEFKLEKAKLLIEAAEEPNDTIVYEPFHLDLDYGTGNVLGFLGATRSGKTHLMHHIYQKYFQDEDFVTVMYACNNNADIYRNFDKNVIQLSNFTPVIPKLMYKINKKNKNKYRFLNILDDQVDNSTKNNQTMKKMMVSYRNSKLSCMISFQFASLMAKSNRANAHYTFLMKMNSDESIEDAIKKYLNSYLGSRGVSMSEKIKRYKAITSNYGFFMIDAIKGTITIHKC